MRLELIKIVSLAAALAASAVAGDCYGVCDRFISPVYYREVLIAEGSYKRPFDLRKEYRINGDGFLEVYFGDGEMYKVTEELRVNERALGRHLRDEAEELLRGGGKKLGEALDSLKGFGHDFYKGVADED